MRTDTPSFSWKEAIRLGLLGGGIAILISLVGMVVAFSERYIVYGWFSMGQVLFLAPIVLVLSIALRKQNPSERVPTLLHGLLAGQADEQGDAADGLVERYRLEPFGRAVRLAQQAVFPQQEAVVAGEDHGRVVLQPQAFYGVEELADPVIDLGDLAGVQGAAVVHLLRREEILPVPIAWVSYG